MVAVADESYPGQRLGLPAKGHGSLASWGARILALIIDWAVCTGVAVALFGTGVVTGRGWRAFMTLATFFVESTLLCWLAGGSFGQLICRIAVVRLDRQPIGHRPRRAAGGAGQPGPAGTRHRAEPADAGRPGRRLGRHQSALTEEER